MSEHRSDPGGGACDADPRGAAVELTLTPAGVSLLEAWLLTAASFATSFITAALGLGGGVLMLGLIAVALPPAAVIPVHGLVQLGSNAGRTLLMMRQVAPALAVPFLLGSVAGAGLGGLVVVQLPPALWQTGLGLFILWSAWARMPTFASRGAVMTTGLVSTFLSMFFGATGPFVAAMLKTLGLDRLTHVATHAACMSGQHLLKVLAFGGLGFAFGGYLPLVALMMGAGVAGTWAGRHVLARGDDARFHRVLSILLTLVALRLVWSGASSWLRGG